MVDVDKIPQVEVDCFARALLRAVKKAFDDPQIRAEFEEWKKEREKRDENTCSL